MPFLKNRNVASIEGVPVFDVGRVEIKDRIGQGSFGEVFKFSDLNFTGESAVETVVVKKALGALDGEEKKLFLKEVALLHKLKHSNVVHLKAVTLCFHDGVRILQLQSIWGRFTSEQFRRSIASH